MHSVIILRTVSSYRDEWRCHIRHSSFIS